MKHCCESMDYHLSMRCKQHSDPFDCPDSVIYFNGPKQEYGLIIHDGGPSYLKISYCPWCGKEL
jgi:hypothetical protein